MKKENIEDVYPRDNIYFVYIYAISISVFLFKMSWLDILFIMAIDAVSHLIVHPIEKRIFYLVNPHYLKVKHFEESVKEAKNSLFRQNELFELLSSYPLTRSVYLFFASLIKVLPVGIYIAYFSTNTESFLFKISLFYFADALILIYGTSILFIELHKTTSSMMQGLRSVDGWVENYRSLKLHKTTDYFSFIQNAILVVMLANLLLLFLFSTSISPIQSTLGLVLLFGSAIICIGGIQLKFQRFFQDGLKTMFDSYQQNFLRKDSEAVPLHTSPMLANFEYAFNQLGLKLKVREEEINHWLKHESEQFHLRALGEVAALVAHDMKTPMHVMEMSLQMIEDPSIDGAEKEKYYQILRKNLDLAFSFSNTLNAYLRGDGKDQICQFQEIHFHLLDLLKTQFFGSDFQRIQFELSPETDSLTLNVSRLNGMHFFYNLYHNAIKALIKSKKSSPTIRIWSEALTDGHVAIYIHDNGEGLDLNSFESLTHFEAGRESKDFYNGLGLRLTKTILSRLGGDLDLVPTDIGACFKVSISGHKNNESFSQKLN